MAHNYRTRLVQLKSRGPYDALASSSGDLVGRESEEMVREDEGLLDAVIGEQAEAGWFLHETQVLPPDCVLFVFRKTDV